MPDSLFMMILVVDDNSDIANLVREILQDEGYEAEALLDARGLVAAARRLRPDLILLDVFMPFADVREQLAKLDAEPQARDIPVLLVTGDRETASDVAGVSQVAGVVLKPFDVEDLLAKIARALP